MSCVASVRIKHYSFQKTFINMCNQVCHTVRENALTMNCSLIFKLKCQYIVHLFFLFFSLTIKDKTKISLTIKILHLGQGSFTRKARTIFTLKIIVSIFVKLFLILVLHLRQFFIVRIFVKRATDVYISKVVMHFVFALLNFAT